MFMRTIGCVLFVTLCFFPTITQAGNDIGPSRSTYYDVSIGAPGGINFAVALYTDITTYRVTLGTLGSDVYGVQASASLYRRSSGRFDTTWIITGYANNFSMFSSSLPSYTYVGISQSIRMHHKAFDYLEFGLVSGNEGVSNTQITLRLGKRWSIE